MSNSLPQTNLYNPEEITINIGKNRFCKTIVFMNSSYFRDGVKLILNFVGYFHKKGFLSWTL